MLKRLLGAALTLTVSMSLLAKAPEDYPFGTQILDGGAVVPVALSLVHASNEHMNFCFVHRFADGSIRMSHSMGIHTVTEYGCRDYSTDDGKTWQRLPNGLVAGFNAYDTLDGKKASVGCWSKEERDEHVITRTVEDADGKVTVEKSTLKLPFVSWCQMHRNVLRCKGGRLVMPVKGHKKGHSKWMAFMVESLDDGATWQYVSTILEDNEKRYGEGPNEAELIELANGDLLCYVRVDGIAPLHQLRSKDGGRTWGEDHEIAPFGVAPAATLLQNGAIVVITGRPATYLLIDFTGTGEHYQQYCIYGGSGSSYASVLEIAPNRVLAVFDESDFGSWRTLTRMSRITAMTLDIVKDDDLKVDSDKRMGYEVFYSAASGKLPSIPRGFIPHSYNREGNKMEIRKIAENPEPVLHLEHYGEGQDKFPHVRAGTVSPTATRVRGELRVRLNDLGEELSQFSCRFSLPDPDPARTKGALYGFFAFANDYITYDTVADNGATAQRKVPFKANNAFHTFVFDADTKTSEFRLFVKGEDQPLFIGKMPHHDAIVPGFQFGDGATAVKGSADLAYIGFTAE